VQKIYLSGHSGEKITTAKKIFSEALLSKNFCLHFRIVCLAKQIYFTVVKVYICHFWLKYFVQIDSHGLSNTVVYSSYVFGRWI